MRVYSTPRNIWRAIYPTLIFFGTQIIMSIIIGFVFGMLYAAGGKLTGPEAALEIERIITENTSMMLLAANALCLAAFLPIWLKMKKSLPAYELENAGVLTTTAVLAFMGLNMLLVLILSLGEIYQYFPSYEAIERALGSGNLVFRFLALVVAAPVVEELCLRGITLSRLLSWTSAKVAVTAQAALFAVLHFNLLQGLYSFALGLALGYLYLRCRKLWLCVAAHAAFNLVGFVQSIVEENAVEFPIWWLLPGAVVFVFAAWFFMRLPPARLVGDDARISREY